MRRALDGVDTLFNTYWVRFAHGETTFERAVENTRVLVRAAKRRRRPAHRPRQRHESVALLPRCRTSAARRRSERDVEESGLSYAIVRPTLVFGPRDILVNNIAWGLRRSPVFPIAGDGSYRVQPISVEDTATICADAAGGEENVAPRRGRPGDDLLRRAGAARAPRPSARRRGSCTGRPNLVLALARATGAVRRDVLLDGRGARGPAGEPARLRRASARARELHLVGRSQRRSTRPRLRLGARAQLPSDDPT